MQTLESLGVPASAFLLPHNMPEAPNGQQQGWVHPQQGFNPSLDQQQGVVGMNQTQSNHVFVMNNVKPEQQIPRREEVLSSPPPASPSVITATYNPTYNRCLPKILSDLDCEMKIKQVLRCIENILLENGDVDLQQQAYKLPDRSSSPQFAKTKKPKFKEDEEMMQSPGPAAINLPLATNSPATLINKAANKNPIKINVKVEPEADKAPGPRTPAYNEQAVPNGSPRGQMFDFSYKPQQQNPSQANYSPSPMGAPPQRPFGYEGYPNGMAHPPQPMIPHIQLSMSSPHLSPGAANSPHLQHHLHASSPHIHTAHANSPHAHSPLHAGHTNSPHLVHSPLPHSPLGQASQNSPQLPNSNGALSPHQIPIQQYQVISRDQTSDNHAQNQDYHYQPMYDGVQEAGGFKAHENGEQQAHKKETTMQDASFVLDPALFAQYLAQNQQQLHQLQQQIQQQQLQHSIQQQRQQIHQHQQHQQHQQQHQQQTQQQQQHTQQTQGQQSQTQQTQQQHQQHHPQSIPVPHLFDPAHPISLSGHHPMSLSGHLFQQIGPDGSIRLEEDDKWILSLLNTDSSIAHDLSLSGHIPPL